METHTWIIIGFAAIVMVVVGRLFLGKNRTPKRDCPKCGTCMKGQPVEHKDGGRVATIKRDEFGNVEGTMTLIIGRRHYKFFCKRCSLKSMA